MSLSTYQSLSSEYSAKTSLLRKQLGWLSLLRLILFIVLAFFVYKSFQTGASYFILLSAVSLVCFFIIVGLYDKLNTRSVFYKALVKLNEDEINFLAGQPSVYDNGKEYIDPQHPYSYDLGIFGEAGLFSFLNRTSTQFGKAALSNALLYSNTAFIEKLQQAVKELKDKLEFRQHIQAYGMVEETKEKEIHQLKVWINSPSLFNNKILYYGLCVFPVITIGLLVSYFVSENDALLNLLIGSFILNLIISFLFARKISLHLSVSTSVTKILQQFTKQLKEIEKQSFQSELLKEIQEKLRSGNRTASQNIARLAQLFNYLEMVMNIVTSLLLNGLFLFHIHILHLLEKWKKEQGSHIMKWLQLLGEIEALNSFANFSFNNPSFCYPEVNSTEILAATNMGHPLIRNRTRVDNNISFDKQKIVVLTGSNMSGKSTFLRTLGINLILAKAGSPVCAEQFTFYPYDVYVSMNISDSLKDSESFFYAELKRLQHIIQQLQKGNKTFVILDEILRGTNSNDKHSGTVGLIRKLADMKASGIIATHDLTVSELEKEYPNYISNKCLESETINDELHFDYKLRDGVCTTLTASFLMKKMGIIESK